MRKFIDPYSNEDSDLQLLKSKEMDKIEQNYPEKNSSDKNNGKFSKMCGMCLSFDLYFDRKWAFSYYMKSYYMILSNVTKRTKIHALESISFFHISFKTSFIKI